MVTFKQYKDIVYEIIGAAMSVHRTYLRLTRMPVGLLINFGVESLEGERYAFIADQNLCCRLDKNMHIVK